MPSVTGRVRAFWHGPGGAREVLAIGLPLILSHLSFTLQTFVDRLFLTWYSAEAVAGAVTGHIVVWTVIGFFVGTGEYLTAFIGQYYGARRYERVGVAVWQGLYFALAAGLIGLALVPLLGPAFRLAGHDPLVQRYEVEYAQILLGGSGAAVLAATLSTFFAGRGQTRVILLVNVLATLVNIVFDWWWIFDRPGRPGWGVAGAAWATVLSQVVASAVYLTLILQRRWRETFHTLAGWRFERALFGRLLRFGLPTGLQYSTEVAAFALFMLLIGRLGTVPLAASGVTLGLNMIVFMPMLGLGIGVSSLVARYLGAEQPGAAERSTWSAFVVSLVYMIACGALYLLLPRLLLRPYAAGATDFAAVEEVAVVLLRFVAVYSIFDMFNVIFAAGLKGAGDTAYPFKLTLVLSWILMLVPTYVGMRLGLGAYGAWTFASLYVGALGLLMQRRFRAGRWKSLRVIEPNAAPAA